MARHTAAPRPVATALLSFTSVLLLAVAAFAQGPPPAPRWDHGERLSSAEGYVQLRWLVDDDEIAWVYQLQEGRRPVFAETDTRYEGPQHASFVSGLEDGTTYFRVRARRDGSTPVWSEWSTTLEVEVRHHDRRFALGLMAVGGIVFLATAGFLIAHRNDPAPTGRSS